MARLPSVDSQEAAEQHEHVKVLREGLIMALYVSLSLLAVMVAWPAPIADGDRSAALSVLFISAGLIAAHQVAFRLSSRLFSPGSELSAGHVRVLWAQLAGGAIVTALAVIPILVFGNHAYPLSMGLLLAFVLAVGYAVARSTPVSRIRALLYVGAVGLGVVGVLAVKSLAIH